MVNYTRILFLFITTFLVGCTGTIDLDLPQNEEKIVAFSNFKVGSLIEFQISKSHSIVEANNIVYLNEANIELYANGNFLEVIPLIFDGENGDQPKFKSTTVRPVSDVEYTIRVDAENLNSIEAKAIAPTKIPLNSLSIDNVNKTQKPASMLIDYDFDLQFDFEDPIDTKNYYHLIASHRITLQMGMQKVVPGLKFEKSVNSPFEYITHFEEGILFTDESFNGENVILELPSYFSEDEILTIDDVLLELRHVSKDYYQFHKSYSLQKESFEIIAPFSEPVTIFNNIEGGYGNFSGYSSSSNFVRFDR